jgi:LysM repeat protein
MPPDYRPNPLARVVAVVALIAAFFLIVFVIAGSGGSSDEGSDDDSTQLEESSGPTTKGANAVEAGVWIVREGDTLAQISEETGIDVDELLAMNPDLDPQALIQGQRIALR